MPDNAMCVRHEDLDRASQGFWAWLPSPDTSDMVVHTSNVVRMWKGAVTGVADSVFANNVASFKRETAAVF